MGKVWASNVSREVPRIIQKYFMCILLLIILLTGCCTQRWEFSPHKDVQATLKDILWLQQ